MQHPLSQAPALAPYLQALQRWCVNGAVAAAALIHSVFTLVKLVIGGSDADATSAPPPPPTCPEGTAVALVGLKDSRLNGETGQVSKRLDEATGRVAVRLSKGREVLVKPSNLTVRCEREPPRSQPPARALPPAAVGEITVGARIAMPRLVQCPASLHPRTPAFWSKPAINELVQFGFTACQAEAALIACEGKHEVAAEWLFSRLDNLDAAVAEVLYGPPAADASAPFEAVGVVEGVEGVVTLAGVVDGGRVVVKLDCGLRVVVAAASITSRAVVAAADTAESPADRWFREEAFVNVLPFLDGRTLARFVLASRRADVRRWADARVERAVTARAPALLAARHEVDLYQWFAGSLEPQLADDLTPRQLPLDRVEDYLGGLYCLFAALPLESMLRAGHRDRGVEAYAELHAYVYRTGGPDDAAGARALLATLREVLATHSSYMPVEGKPGDASDVLRATGTLLEKNVKRPRPAATLESSYYDADDARATKTALGFGDERFWSSGVVSYACGVQHLEEVYTAGVNLYRRSFRYRWLWNLCPRPGDSLYDMLDKSCAVEELKDEEGKLIH